LRCNTASWPYSHPTQSKGSGKSAYCFPGWNERQGKGKAEGKYTGPKRKMKNARKMLGDERGDEKRRKEERTG